MPDACRREKNRLAARRCRAKREATLTAMQAQVASLAAANAALRLEASRAFCMARREKRISQDLKALMTLLWQQDVPSALDAAAAPSSAAPPTVEQLLVEVEAMAAAASEREMAYETTMAAAAAAAEDRARAPMSAQQQQLAHAAAAADAPAHTTATLQQQSSFISRPASAVAAHRLQIKHEPAELPSCGCQMQQPPLTAAAIDPVTPAAQNPRGRFVLPSTLFGVATPPTSTGQAAAAGCAGSPDEQLAQPGGSQLGPRDAFNAPGGLLPASWLLRSPSAARDPATGVTHQAAAGVANADDCCSSTDGNIAART